MNLNEVMRLKTGRIKTRLNKVESFLSLNKEYVNAESNI